MYKRVAFRGIPGYLPIPGLGYLKAKSKKVKHPETDACVYSLDSVKLCVLYNLEHLYYSAPKSNYHKQTLTHVRTFEIANENKKCSQGGGITICFAPIPVFHDYFQ